MPSFVPRSNQPDKDLVMTPANLAKEVLDHFNPQGHILDPSRGMGAFYNQFPTGKHYWCELEEGVDFMEFGHKVDWIITNPPWSKMRQFLQKGMEVSDNIVYLTTINHYTTKRRLRDMRQMGFGLKEIYNVPTPLRPWPSLGFQLAAIHTQRGYTGDCKISWHPDLV